MFVSDQSLKAASEAVDIFPYTHGTLRQYACTCFCALCMSRAALECHPLTERAYHRDRTLRTY